MLRNVHVREDYSRHKYFLYSGHEVIHFEGPGCKVKGTETFSGEGILIYGSLW